MQREVSRLPIQPGVSRANRAAPDVAHRRELRIVIEFGRIGGQVALQERNDIRALESQQADVVQRDDHGLPGLSVSFHVPILARLVVAVEG